MVFVSRKVEVVDSYVATLSDVFECDGTSDSCCAASYSGGFGEKEVVRHGGGFWRGRFLLF